MAQDLSQHHKTVSTDDESEQLEHAACNAVTSLHENNELFMCEEEKEQRRKQKFHNMNGTKHLNIERPSRPIAGMIVEKTQGQCPNHHCKCSWTQDPTAPMFMKEHHPKEPHPK
jgi:hypothetical protein